MYQIYVPTGFRLEFNNLLSNPIRSLVNIESFVGSTSKILTNIFQNHNTEYICLIEEAKKTLSNFLKYYIESVRSRSNNVIDKTPIMKLFGFPPININDLVTVPMFFRENNESF